MKRKQGSLKQELACAFEDLKTFVQMMQDASDMLDFIWVDLQSASIGKKSEVVVIEESLVKVRNLRQFMDYAVDDLDAAEKRACNAFRSLFKEEDSHA